MRVVICACTALAAMAVAAPARAISIVRVGSVIQVTAQSGEHNDLYVEDGTNGFLRVEPDVIVVRDAFNDIQVGDGCSAYVSSFQPTAAVCPLDGLTEVAIATGDGNDSVNLNNSPVASRVDGGPGDDLLGGSATLPDELSGGDGDDQLTGRDDDTLHGDAGNDQLFGYGQRVTMIGDDGDDRLSVTGSGALSGGSGDDDLAGGSGDDTLDGDAGDDNVVGGNGNDTLRGGRGDDDLNGGRGDDVLDGEQGADDLDGERGSDIITSDDGAADHSIACGQSGDVLHADRFDAVNVDCERVDGPTMPVAARGMVTFTLACPNGCAGTLALATAGGRRIGGGSFGNAAVAAARAQAGRPRVVLSAAGRALLHRRGRLAVRASMRIVDGSGRRFHIDGRYTLKTTGSSRPRR
jgi:Ca2+-binding RTX toxin-like protein